MKQQPERKNYIYWILLYYFMSGLVSYNLKLIPVQRNNTINIHFLFLIHISDVRDRSAAMLTSSRVVSNLQKFMFIKYICKIWRKTTHQRVLQLSLVFYRHLNVHLQQCSSEWSGQCTVLQCWYVSETGREVGNTKLRQKGFCPQM